jgi:hypothetical protein
MRQAHKRHSHLHTTKGEDMSIEVMRQVRNALVWNLNTDLDNISVCEQWAKMLRKNIDDLDEAIEQAEQKEENT